MTYRRERFVVNAHHSPVESWVAGSSLVLLYLVIDSAASATQHAGILIVGALLGTIIGLCALAISVDNPPLVILGAALVAAAVQTTFVGFWLPDAAEASPSALLLIELKTWLLWTTAILLCGRHLRQKIDKALWRVIIPFLWLGALALIEVGRHGGSITAAIAYVRNFSAPGLALALAAMAVGRVRTVVALDKIFGFLAVLLLAGAAAQIAIGDSAWDVHVLHLSALETVKGPLSSATDFFGHTVSRMRSLLGEPIDASYTFAALTCWALIRRSYVLGAFLLVANILTFAKGGLTVTLIAAVWFSCQRVKRVRRPLVLAAVAVSAMIPLFIWYGSASGISGSASVFTNPLAYASGTNSAFAHVSGLVLGVTSVVHHPLGFGTGAGGNFSSLFATGPSAQWISSGSESAVGVLAYQLGLPGLALLSIGATRLVTTYGTAKGRGPQIAVGMFIGWMAASLFQENSFGPQAALPVLTVIVWGLLQGREARNEASSIGGRQLGRTSRSAPTDPVRA